MFNGENKTKKGEKREKKKKNQFPKIPNWILFCFVSFFFFILGAKGGERDIDDFASKSCWILDVVKGSLLLLSPPFHRHVDSVNGPGQQKNKKKRRWSGLEAQLIGMSSALQTPVRVSLSTSVQLLTQLLLQWPLHIRWIFGHCQ